MASQLPPTMAPGLPPEFAAPNPYLSAGQMLTGFGAGLLSQGPSFTPIAPFQGLGVGVQGAQQGLDNSYRLQGMRQQNILAGQAFRKGQQDLASGNLGLANTVMRMNYMRSRMGLPPVTADDLAANPSLSLGNPVMTGAPQAGSQMPAGAPQMPQGSQGGSYGQPASAASQASMVPSPAAPGAPSGVATQPPAGDPYGFNTAVGDAMFIDPKLGRVEMEVAQASPQYQSDLAMWKVGLVRGQDGKWRNQDGSVASQAQLAAAISGAQQWAGVGPENAKTAFRAGVTPITQTVPVYGPDGRTIVGYQQSNTNQLAAAGNPTPGLPVVNPTDPAQAAQLAAAGAGGAAAGAAPYDFVSVDVPNPNIPGSTIKTLMSKADAAAFIGGKGAQGGATVPSGQPQMPQGSVVGGTQPAMPAAPTATGAQPAAPQPAPKAPGVPGQVTLGPADQAMMPQLTDALKLRQEAEPAARDTLVQLGELRGALDGLPTGPGTEALNDGGAYLTRLGIDINSVLPDGIKTDPVKFAIAKKNFNLLGMAMARSNFPGGRITNTDVSLAMTATPNFGNMPGANKELLNNIEAIQRLKIDRAEFDRQYLASHSNLPSLQMETDWQQRVLGMKNVPDIIKQSYLGFGDQAANPQSPRPPQINMPDGALGMFKGSDGQVYFQFKNKNGNGFYYQDSNGKPVK